MPDARARSREEEGPERVTRTVPCRGHAFGDDLLCACGTTWSEHQAHPTRCRIGAQRCKRAEPGSDAGSA